MSKPSTPVRRAKVGPGRPSSAGGEIPLTASMEVLTPDPCMPQLIGVGRSQEFHGPAMGAKPRTPATAPLNRTRSTDGRRSASGHHEVIPLTSTSSKVAHPVPLPLSVAMSMPHAASSASSVIMASPVGIAVTQSAQLPCTGSGTSSPYGVAGGNVTQAPSRMDVTAISQASSRFNPVSEGDEEGLQPRAQPHTAPAPGVQSGDALRESCHVVVGGSAAAVAQRAAAAAGATGRRYDTPSSAVESVALSQEQLGREGLGSANGEGGSGVDRQLRREESEQVPGTPASVASGRVGGVFFTDLQRSFGGETPHALSESQDLTGALRYGQEEFDMYSSVDTPQGPRIASARREGTVSAMSRLNPMQSPSASENGDEDDDDGAFAEYAGEEPTAPDGVGPGAGPRPRSGRDASLARSVASGLTDLVNPLQTPSESRATTPLLPSVATGTPPPAAASTSANDSLLLVIHDLYVTDEPDPHADGEALNRPPTAATPSQPPPPLSPAAGSSSDNDSGGAVEGGRGDTGPQQVAQELGAGTADAEAADAARLAASRAAVAELAARSDGEQAQRVSELGEYMVALQERKDESGGRLVELPADWGVMLERLFRQRRSEFVTLEGWLGPRRFEDLPISQLPFGHPDPRVEEGLARIRELDSVLNDKLIAALISHRETFPEQWVEQERQRLEKHTRAVEEALKRERQKRMRAARISRAVTSLEGPVSGVASATSLSYGASSVQGMSRLASQGSVYSRMFVLKPEEEELVERVLKRNDEEGAAINPFDLDSIATYDTSQIATTTAEKTDGGWAAVSVADPEDINLDLLLPSAVVSACSTPTAATPSAPLRPLSARLVDRDAGRPQSAASSYAESRPGTATGGGGGGGTLGMLSPLAVAALRGHPAMLAASPRASTATPNGFNAGGGLGAGGSGLLPEHVYDDPRVAARALRAINARLAAFESEHLWDEGGVLADFKSVTAACSVGQLGSPQPSVVAAGVVTEGGAPSQLSPGARGPSKSVLGGPAVSLSDASVTAGGQRDYLREERLAKELASRERNVDAALRSLKTSEVVRLGEATLKALVEQCRRLQELNEHRRRIEEAEAAARKAQQLKEQLSRSLSARSTDSGRTPKGASPPAGGNQPTPGEGPGGRTSSASSAGRGSAEGAAGGSSGAPGSAQRQNSNVPSSANGNAPASTAASGRRRNSTDAPPPSTSVSISPSAVPAQSAPARGSTSGSTTGPSSSSGAKGGGRVASAVSTTPPTAGTPPKPKTSVAKATTAAPAPAVVVPPLTGSWEGGLPPPPPPPPP